MLLLFLPLLWLYFVVGETVTAGKIESNQNFQPEAGDIFFQSLPPSPVIVAIEGSTHSPYSHCGILAKEDGAWWIYEAIGPVKKTKLEDWIKQGRGGRYDVYRLKAPYRPKISELLSAVKTYFGRPYDIQYDFDDGKIYCSELIFKAFKTVYGENLGEIKKLRDLDWKPYEAVIRAIDPSLPLEREMITPRDLASAEQLELVFRSMSETDITAQKKKK